MKQFLSIIFGLTLTSVCFGQVMDDFADGDFSNSPSWSGSTSQFIVNASKQLQLSSAVAGQSYLSTAFSSTNLANLEWRIYVKQGFAPSATNNGRVYLASDQADLTLPLNGYYLQFGEALSNDAVELFRQSGSTSVSVCRGTNAAIANSFAVGVKITRDNAGLWKLYVDYAGGSNFLLEASGTDATLNSSSFFGVRCTYTVTNANKFFYDDIYAGPPQVPVDTTPPTVTSVQATSSSSIAVLFSESVNKSSAELISNYWANNAIGAPLSALLQVDGRTVVLSFTKNFTNGLQNQLQTANVADLAGNTMTSATFPFLFFQAVPANAKDIILTEIFADPSPQVGLPVQEYIEIYNRSPNPFDLAGWKLSDGTSTATFGSQIILPQQYFVVCSSANTGLFSSYGKVIGVSNFPTLNNSGDDLTLKDASAKNIDSVTYSLEWYHDVDKQEGGWALEIIDVDNICGEENNWAASEDPSGGTPAKQNSVFANRPDLTGPQLLSVVPASATILNLMFNEKLEKGLSGVDFAITPTIAVSAKYFADQSLRKITLELSVALSSRELYSLRVNNLTDCAGNFIQQGFSQLSFALPEVADSLDILVNEILFNPISGGVDFVEVYNNSPKFINLKNWTLGNYESGAMTNPSIVTTGDFILKPSSYLVFTSDLNAISMQYLQSNQNAFFKTSLPSLPDDAGSIGLASERGSVIDHFAYSEKMHSALLKEKEGVSLERISFSELTNDASNWKSANASVGFATPGLVNSNARPESSIAEDAVRVDPEIFSPSVPGQDFAKINYRFDQSGMAANVKILDSQGRLIKTLANNETLAHEGFFRWDGDRDDGTRSRMGYYVVWFEIFDTSGATTIFRKRTVIGK